MTGQFVLDKRNKLSAYKMKPIPNQDRNTIGRQTVRNSISKLDAGTFHKRYLAQLVSNIQSGNLKIESDFVQEALHARDERAEELQEYFENMRNGPKLAWEQGAAERRKKQEEEENSTCEIQNTGKGGSIKYWIPNSNQKDALRSETSA
tara:strand:+ start:538 stop:984 length:447 start_codon:yes stop_codon:yes gene_type:complete